jgi:hypothetical protein
LSGVAGGAERSVGSAAGSAEVFGAVEEKVVRGAERTDVLIGLAAGDAVEAGVRPDRNHRGGGTTRRRHARAVVPFKVLAGRSRGAAVGLRGGGAFLREDGG